MRELEFYTILMDVIVLKNSVGLKSVFGIFLNNEALANAGLGAHYRSFHEYQTNKKVTSTTLYETKICRVSKVMGN